MRCGLRQKIQHPSCKTQPGKEIVVGKSQTFETQNKTVQNRTDTALQNHELLSSRNDQRTFNTAQIPWSFARMCRAGAVKVLIFFIRIYQKTISPLLPECCRFTPTCSHYAVDALNKHGVLKGLILTFWRLARCQPFCKGGFDPVPDDFHLWRSAPVKQDSDIKDEIR